MNSPYAVIRSFERYLLLLWLGWFLLASGYFILTWLGAPVGLSFILLLLASGVVLLITIITLRQRLEHPLATLATVLDAWENGTYSQRLPTTAKDSELDPLFSQLNRVAQGVAQRLRSLSSQEHELAAVLSSLGEGIVVVDSEQRLLRVNEAAQSLLSLDPEKALGRSIQEAVRHYELQQFVQRTLASTKPSAQEVLIWDGEERILELRGSALMDRLGAVQGALLVLNDVSRVRRLQKMRTDFVANVSHELKTPITSLKAATETLIDGALESPEQARRFLAIIERHVDRMGAIIEDLLSLSKLEEDSESSQLERSWGDLSLVVASAVEALQLKAHAQGVAIEQQVPEGLFASINAVLLEQALGNLIDNAIKYSEAGSKVLVRVLLEPLVTSEEAVEGRLEPDRQYIRLEVQDFGPGIERSHLPRIFERFYRVDKSRARKIGGTGLGLAIVKHIAQLHGGMVAVESTPGKGSTFAIVIAQGKAHTNMPVSASD